jgi:hypothetical protein
MSQNDDPKAVRDILMCVIGESLMEADASFMFGHDFSPIIDKYAPLLKKTTIADSHIHEDFDSLRTTIKNMNEYRPFLGTSYSLVQEKIDRIEQEIYG